MAPVVFLTTNSDKHLEVATLLSREGGLEVVRKTATLPVPPTILPGEVARFRALAAFRVLGEPVFAEALAIDLPDGPVSGASYRQAFEMPGGSSWLKKHEGVSGIARIAVGYTANGVEAQVFEMAIPGRLRVLAHGRGNAAWERHWIPDGKGEQTLADLAGQPGSDEIRNAPYLALAKSLRSMPR